MQRALHGVNYVFVNFQIHMHKTFPFGKHKMDLLKIFLFLIRPTKHNNKTHFIEIFKPKMQQKKVHDYNCQILKPVIKVSWKQNEA